MPTVIAAAAGIISLLVVVGASVAYLAIPEGRCCPRCGTPTAPIRLRRWLRPFRRLVQWRWCPSCAWEGMNRTASGPRPDFRWGRPEEGEAPFFQWGPEPAPPAHDDPLTLPPDDPSGFRWKGGEETIGEPGFQWASEGGESDAGGVEPRAPGVITRLIRWFRGSEPGDFRWKDPS